MTDAPGQTAEKQEHPEVAKLVGEAEAFEEADTAALKAAARNLVAASKQPNATGDEREAKRARIKLAYLDLKKAVISFKGVVNTQAANLNAGVQNAADDLHATAKASIMPAKPAEIRKA